MTAMLDGRGDLAASIDALVKALEAAVARGESHKAGVAAYFAELHQSLVSTAGDDVVLSVARQVSTAGKITELGLTDAELRAFVQAFEAAERCLAGMAGCGGPGTAVGDE